MTTLNKNLSTPANNSSNWDVPLNSNFNILDIAFGGVQAFNLAAFAGGTIAVSSGTYIGSYPANTASYLPLIFSITGTPTGNTTLQIPYTVGGEWIVHNSIPSSTSYTLTISSGGGGNSVVVSNGTIRTVFSDGTNINFSDNQTTTAGSTSQVIYNSGGSLAGSPNLTFDGTTLTANALAVSTNITVSGSESVAGPITSGGIIKSTSGGFTFPDSTTQTTAATTSSIPTIQAFTASGTFTVPAGVTKVMVTVVGAGGGGGGDSGSAAGAGGGAGGAAIKTITGLTPGDTVAVTIGAGGAGVSSGTAATGGTSSFGAYCSATGGTGGRGNGGDFGIGGSGTGGDINYTGGGGTSNGGGGGNSILGGGGGGRGTTSNGVGGAGSANTGGGGGGGHSSPNAGGAGGSGVVIVQY